MATPKQHKYIIVTGGVCSSLGKGIAASSIGALLESCNYKVAMLKADPYLNIDAGTMSPHQHGEVFVMEDGGEADLDLGNYERYTACKVTKAHSITTGQVYQTVIDKERAGKYLGKCVQVIPHITNEIKQRIYDIATPEIDVVIAEIGGTVGDIESTPFLEAVRQLRKEVGPADVALVHVTLVPRIFGAEELKTKPTQHTVQKLNSLGIQPDILLCRMDEPMPQEVKDKIALFTEVKPHAIISARNVAKSVYEVPLAYHKQGLTQALQEKLQLPTTTQDMQRWEDLEKRIYHPKTKLRIGIVGKYMAVKDAYTCIYEALTHAGYAHESAVTFDCIPSEKITPTTAEELLGSVDAILIPGGFGYRGIEGMINAAHYARTHQKPLFGICLGMQVIVIEYARNVLGYQDANSTEFDAKTAHPVINLLEDQHNVVAKGGTMRLGSYTGTIVAGSQLHGIYGAETLSERHRHRYEVNNSYVAQLAAKGMKVASTTPVHGCELAETIEIQGHPFAIGVQFHPEFQSTPFAAHPLFAAFINATLKATTP